MTVPREENEHESGATARPDPADGSQPLAQESDHAGDPRSELGLHGENLAESFLNHHGLKTVARRFATPVGELDLVMRQGRTIVFVEVKTQSDRAFKDPQDQVTPTKQHRLFKAAKWLLIRKRWTDRPCRFDVLTVLLSPDGEAEIEHFPDAFAPRHW